MNQRIFNTVLSIIALALLVFSGLMYKTVNKIKNEAQTVVEPTQEFGFRQFSSVLTNANGLTATSTSSTLPSPVLAKSFTNLVFAVETTNNATATIKFSGTIMDEATDPTQTSSITNQHANLQVIDLQDGTAYDGDTGIVLTGTNAHRMFEVNVNSLSWIRPYISSYSTGTIYIYSIASDNQ